MRCDIEIEECDADTCLRDVTADSDTIATGGDTGASSGGTLCGGVALPKGAIAPRALCIGEVDDGD